MPMTLTPEQTKAFCQAWQIEPLNKWRISSINSLGNLVAWETSDKEEADYCRQRPSPAFRVDNIYPPLTLELLLGVLNNQGVSVRLEKKLGAALYQASVGCETPKIHWPFGYSSDPTMALIEAMHRFKNLNFDLQKGE